MQKISENLYDQDLRSLGDYVVELTTGYNKGVKAALAPERRMSGSGTLKKWWKRQ